MVVNTLESTTDESTRSSKDETGTEQILSTETSQMSTSKEHDRDTISQGATSDEDKAIPEQPLPLRGRQRSTKHGGSKDIFPLQISTRQFKSHIQQNPEDFVPMHMKIDLKNGWFMHGGGTREPSTVGIRDLIRKYLPNEYQIWRWEGDKQALPRQWLKLIRRCFGLHFTRKWSELALRATFIEQPQFDPEGFFFVTIDEDIVGTSMAWVDGKELAKVKREQKTGNSPFGIKFRLPSFLRILKRKEKVGVKVISTNHNQGDNELSIKRRHTAVGVEAHVATDSKDMRSIGRNSISACNLNVDSKSIIQIGYNKTNKIRNWVSAISGKGSGSGLNEKKGVTTPPLRSKNKRREENIGGKSPTPKPLRNVPIGRVHWLCVHPDHRRRGLGELLAALTLSYHRFQGRRFAYLKTELCRAEAIQMYTHMGFRPHPRSPEEKKRWRTAAWRKYFRFGDRTRYEEEYSATGSSYDPSSPLASRQTLISGDRSSEASHDTPKKMLDAARRASRSSDDERNSRSPVRRGSLPSNHSFRSTRSAMSDAGSLVIDTRWRKATCGSRGSVAIRGTETSFKLPSGGSGSSRGSTSRQVRPSQSTSKAPEHSLDTSVTFSSGSLILGKERCVDAAPSRLWARRMSPATPKRIVRGSKVSVEGIGALTCGQNDMNGSRDVSGRASSIE